MILCKIKNVELYSEEPERFRPYIDHISGTNRDEPRVMIIQGSVEKMPFVSGRFDLVTAFETVFF